MTTPVTSAKRSILVTLDISHAGRLALDIAARMAAMLQATLEGVFVEDIDLVCLSSLPFVREVCAYSPSANDISPERIQRDLNAQARQAERMLIRHAESMGVSYSFRTWCGSATLETLSASFNADILSIARPSAYKRRVLPSQSRQINNISVLSTGVSQVNNVLLAALKLGDNLGVPNRVLIQDGNNVQKNIHAIINEFPVEQRNRLNIIYYDNLYELLTLLKVSGNTVLFVECGHPLLTNIEFNRCIDELALTILIVR